MTRSSSPSYRPATSTSAGSVANSRAITCVNGAPCALRYTRGAPGARALAASIAFDIGSGLSTMPGPPPYGRSSTVRCTSLVCARGSSQPTLTMSRSIARPSTPTFSASRTSSGNSVTTSMCMSRVRSPLKILWPIHDQRPVTHDDLSQVLRRHGYQVLARAPGHHHRVARRVDEMVDHTQQHAFHVLHFEPDQIRAVMLAPAGRWQFLAAHEQQLARQPARGVAFFDTFELRDPPVALGSHFLHIHLA